MHFSGGISRRKLPGEISRNPELVLLASDGAVGLLLEICRQEVYRQLLWQSGETSGCRHETCGGERIV